MWTRLGKTLAIGAIWLAAISSEAPLARASTSSSVLNSARIERRGATQEIHFGFDGAAPRLNLSTHGSELWIDLRGARIGVPPRPLFGNEAPPIESVRAIDSGGRQRIVIEVAGKADYAIARLKHEIVLRIAAAGADLNIAAPILVHHGPPRLGAASGTAAPYPPPARRGEVAGEPTVPSIDTMAPRSSDRPKRGPNRSPHRLNLKTAIRS